MSKPTFNEWQSLSEKKGVDKCSCCGNEIKKDGSCGCDSSCEHCGGKHDVKESSCGSMTKKKKKKLSEMISTSMSGRRYRDVSGTDDQKQKRKKGKRDRQLKKEKMN